MLSMPIVGGSSLINGANQAGIAVALAVHVAMSTSATFPPGCRHSVVELKIQQTPGSRLADHSTVKCKTRIKWQQIGPPVLIGFGKQSESFPQSQIGHAWPI